MTYATFNNFASNKTQDSLTTVFKSALSATDIATLQSMIETNYTVAFLYTGPEFDYTVTLQGTQGPFTRAMNTLFPKGRNDIIIQPSHS